VLASSTLLLIWVGGAVTTYEAGMAVEDWPTTFGYWFYPLKLWLAVWDVFLEHGHRTLAQWVGIVSIALAVAVWSVDPRKWTRWLALATVAGVMVQGTLGGLRVIFTDRLLAKLHGCVAPLLLACCAALITLTSRAWLRPDAPKPHRQGRRGQRLALAVTLAIYVEIVLGAQLRHLSWDSRTGWFSLCVWLKLITAGLITIGLGWLVVHVLGRLRDETGLGGRALLLAGVFFVQLLFGAATWVANYGWPNWFTDRFWAVTYTVVAEGRLQVLTTTTHAALGALNLAVSLCLALWLLRRLRSPLGDDCV
jgi:cytochrome c oxidase assembly protein subunit 15